MKLKEYAMPRAASAWSVDREVRFWLRRKGCLARIETLLSRRSAQRWRSGNDQVQRRGAAHRRGNEVARIADEHESKTCRESLARRPGGEAPFVNSSAD